ncbi:hypothetical protein M8C21_028457 [Ambrosia artemisiifolia]|uniref:FBD domain-containing protein n=1 Tax=Ambrosia artemisiifolia TaxID=4212 RepID=A0AAD5C7J1_AMBAR|nr:hypothetical protein M8C21_028457 [Ambrosia artemisiifolia]
MAMDDGYDEIESTNREEEYSVILKTYSDVWLEQLSELEIHCYRDVKLELELMTFILARSPNLKKVIFRHSWPYGSGKELQRLKTLLRPPCASPSGHSDPNLPAEIGNDMRHRKRVGAVLEIGLLFDWLVVAGYSMDDRRSFRVRGLMQAHRDIIGSLEHLPMEHCSKVILELGRVFVHKHVYSCWVADFFRRIARGLLPSCASRLCLQEVTHLASYPSISSPR